MTPTAEERFFTPMRIRAWGGALLLAYAAKLVWLVLSANWPVDAAGRPVLADFVFIWSGGQLSFAGNGLGAYDHATFTAAQDALNIADRFGIPPYRWVYPPPFLLVVPLIAWVPYAAGFALWVLATLGLYLLVIDRIIPERRFLWLALLPYGAAIAIREGQTSFLLSALLGLSLYLLPRRPFSAGMVLALMVYKPQFGLIFPIVFFVSGQWRAIAGAVTMLVVQAVACTWVYGLNVWSAFWGSFNQADPVNLQNVPGLVVVLQTAFGFVYWIGGGLPLQWSVHLVFAAIITAIVCILFRHPVPDALKSAALAIGVLCVTPYMLAYDLLAVAVPGAFLIRDCQNRGILPGERSLLAGVLLVLLFSFYIPVGPFVLAVLMWTVLRRAQMAPALLIDRVHPERPVPS